MSLQQKESKHDLPQDKFTSSSLFSSFLWETLKFGEPTPLHLHVKKSGQTAWLGGLSARPRSVKHERKPITTTTHRLCLTTAGIVHHPSLLGFILLLPSFLALVQTLVNTHTRARTGAESLCMHRRFRLIRPAERGSVLFFWTTSPSLSVSLVPLSFPFDYS